MIWDALHFKEWVRFDVVGIRHDGFGEAVKSCLADGGDVVSHTEASSYA